MIAQREINKAQGGGPPGGHGGMGGMGAMGGMGGMDRMNMDRMGPGPNGSMVNIPPSLMNNPNIPNEIIHGLQAGRIGSTVFVANVRLPEFFLFLFFPIVLLSNKNQIHDISDVKKAKQQIFKIVAQT